jgi:hypothetical protein
MSSSRSLASARTKRAAGNTTIPGNTEQPDQNHPAPVQQPVAKLSLPQAINRIGDRLNQLELFAETTTTVVDEIQDFHSNTSDKYIVDTDVFTSLVSRIEALERTTPVKSGNDVSAILSSPSSSVVASSVTNDIIELKSHLIRLQTYVMETNAKLQDMVFSGNGSSIVNFGDIFSDSHPTPPTLLRSTEIDTLDTGSIPGSDVSVEEVGGVVDNDSTILTADNGEDAPH